MVRQEGSSGLLLAFRADAVQNFHTIRQFLPSAYFMRNRSVFNALAKLNSRDLVVRLGDPRWPLSNRLIGIDITAAGSRETCCKKVS